MKPYRGKRTGPQSRPSGFSLLKGGGVGLETSRLRLAFCLPFAGALSGGRALRPALWPPEALGKGSSLFGGSIIVPGSVGRPGGRGSARLGVGAGPPASVRLTRTASSARRPRLSAGLGLLASISGSAASTSVSRPTRLETRTKESNTCASHWALRNLKA